jgi:hypothetical protein
VGCKVSGTRPLARVLNLAVRFVISRLCTKTEFFQADATVVHSTCGVGMGVMFHAVSPPFLIVLQRWLIRVVGTHCSQRDAIRKSTYVIMSRFILKVIVKAVIRFTRDRDVIAVSTRRTVFSRGTDPSRPQLSVAKDRLRQSAESNTSRHEAATAPMDWRAYRDGNHTSNGPMIFISSSRNR